MNARYYDPQLARFISADSMIPNGLNPQTLNRYSYVYNSPTLYTDPTGHQGCVENNCLKSPPRTRSDPSEWAPWPLWSAPPLVSEAEPFHLSTEPIGGIEIKETGSGIAGEREVHIGGVGTKDITALCTYCVPENIRWQYEHMYTIETLIGPIVPPFITPRAAMSRMQKNPNLVFPFVVEGLGGETSILKGARYNLVRALYPGSIDPVEVVEVTPQSFAFETLPGHFRGAGQIVGFRIYERNGYLYLEQFGTSAGTPLDPIHDKGASGAWSIQAQNLRGLLYGYGRHEVFPPKWLGR